MVLTGSPPGNNGVGAILQRQILEEVPRDRLRIITINPRSVDPKSLKDNVWVDDCLTRKYEHAYRPVGGAVGNLISRLAHAALCRPVLREVTKQCVSAGRQHRCEAVLVVLESPTPIFVAEQVAKQLDVPLYCFVMDGPRLHTHDYGYHGALKEHLLAAFDSAMHHASRIATAGEAMQMAYQSAFNKPTSILRQGVEYREAAFPELSTEGPIKIGLAGSITAREAFMALTDELDRREWTLANRPVIVRIAGAHLRLTPSGPQHIEYYGWRKIPEMLRLMSECDFLYMPQPFSGHLREFAELSFPNKLCTYVPARRPIMLHTPPSASLPKFFDRYPCGPRSTDLAAADLVNQTEQCIQNPAEYRSFQDTVDAAFREALNTAELKRQIYAFLGCSGIDHK
ncbi:hypothetical protein Enr13x_29980 [Stieleria neptunia]|uniref:Teichuronic acid biosynthesis glycosyltransferase TuaH n=1 Tax=Stieleria neptunia TaxID=2527979 RepID=A0A518HQL5_9BACT|nr:hypothetical protein Enr13x_29980 [Stieleria neptunia]